MPSVGPNKVAASPENLASGGIVYSVVIPVYKNEASLAEVVERLEWLQTRVPGALEMVFVVDGSPDNSAAVLRELLRKSPLASQLILHSRNFGSFAAIRTGLSAARGWYVAAMAADLQEPVELIETLFERLATGEWEVAIGTRVKREDPLAAKLASRIYWKLYRRLVSPDTPPGGVDIFGCNRAVAQRLASLEESNSSLVGLLFWLGYRRTEVPYNRQERVHGKSAWSWKRKYRYLLDSVFSFTSLPITLILVVGIFGTTASFVAALVVLGAWLFGAIAVPGYTAQMLVMLFTSGSILFALGIVGTYVWRTFENSKGRPQSVVMLQETFGNE
jgi:glycosyltransferase involved in cell wall biosynthesis